MNRVVVVIITSSLIVACIFKYFGKYIHKKYVLSSTDNKTYLVGRGTNSLANSNILAELNAKISLLIQRIKFTRNKKFVTNTRLLISRYKPDNITENIFTSDAVAFTVNKGDEVSFCLKTGNNNVFYDINTLVFVAIHELAHIGSENMGHTKEFVDFFIFLLHEAISVGIYTYIDYSKYPVNYCGMLINETPIRLN